VLFKKILMTDTDMKKFSVFVENEMGIRMPASKKIMLESRLLKRLEKLGLDNFKDYYNYLTTEDGYREEIFSFISVVSTNKTDFFREISHFNFLFNNILPEFVQNNKYNAKVNIWSSACSTGEEPYSIAIMFEEFLSKYKKKPFDYSILASDISVDVLEKAYNAVYHESVIQTIPKLYKFKYLMKNIHDDKLYRIIPELRKKVFFKRINLINDEFDKKKKMDIIFCRNVLIYFNREKQEKIIKKLINSLNKDGYLIIGHSESMIGFKVNLKSMAPTIYRKI